MVLNSTRLFICYLMEFIRCTHIEMLRFQVMLKWIESFPELMFTGNSLPDFFDRLILEAKNYKPKFEYATSNIVKTVDRFYVKTFTSKFVNQIETEKFNSRILLLNSSRLQIESDVFRYDQSLTNVRFTFTFYLPKESSPSFVTFNYDNSTVEYGYLYIFVTFFNT